MIAQPITYTTAPAYTATTYDVQQYPTAIAASPYPTASAYPPVSAPAPTYSPAPGYVGKPTVLLCTRYKLSWRSAQTCMRSLCAVATAHCLLALFDCLCVGFCLRVLCVAVLHV